MEPATKYYIILSLTVATYFIASKSIFDRVYETLDIVIDELFHIPQGIAYCQRNFTYWDPKITTLPGLYVVSASFLGSYFECDTYNLRFINLLASVINLMLFASILRFIYGSGDALKIVIQSLNLALLPPLYFLSHVYYTDTLSMMFLLAFSRLCFTNKHKFLILTSGAMSVLVRQTNIVWIAMVLGHKVLDILIKTSRVYGNNYLFKSASKHPIIGKDIDKSKLKRYYGIQDLLVAAKYHVSTCFTTFVKMLTFQDWSIILTHSIVIISFCTFVYLNQSIVVGDKKAHEATLHLPQLLYFLVFYGFFGLPYVLNKTSSTIKCLYGNKVLTILITVAFVAAVHYNTVIHPYLLADNRHYTFYVWNRWYGKYEFAKYASVPVYVFLLFNLYENLREQNCISFLFPYTISLFLVLCLQKMIEVRYFLIPYTILRLRFSRPALWMVLFEFLLYICINMVTFHLFFTKQIVWKDFDYVQRIIW